MLSGCFFLGAAASDARIPSTRKPEEVGWVKSPGLEDKKIAAIVGGN